MARLKKSRTIKWAGVEFQPDLLKPVKPVRLGVILFDINESSVGVAVMGRAPNRRLPPKEFEHIGSVTMSIAADWIESLYKDALASDRRNVFESLAERWKWNNLFLSPDRELKASEMRGTIDAIAEKLYEKFVGHPFKEIKQPAKPRVSGEPHAPRVPTLIPDTWRLREIKDRTVGQSLW
jgi:hypothetical protein